MVRHLKHPGDLSLFLRDARARVRPQSVGLPVGGRRRVRGLRRGEVAELAGISEGWYTRFETGGAILSISSVNRVADALLLDAEDRETLMRLARPDVANVSLQAVRNSLSGLDAKIEALRDLARTCIGASSIEELGAVATSAIHRLCGKDSLGYMRQYVAPSDELPIVAVSGPGAGALHGHRQRCETVGYAMEHFRNGRPFGESDIRMSPCAELRTRVDRVGVYAYHTQPIMGARGLHLMLGVAFQEPRAPNDLELRGLETAAAIVELTLCR